jgi:hypothetical protein
VRLFDTKRLIRRHSMIGRSASSRRHSH